MAQAVQHLPILGKLTRIADISPVTAFGIRYTTGPQCSRADVHVFVSIEVGSEDGLGRFGEAADDLLRAEAAGTVGIRIPGDLVIQTGLEDGVELAGLAGDDLLGAEAEASTLAESVNLADMAWSVHAQD